MSENWLGAAVRREVAERARGLCEYCLSPQSFSTAPFHVEHILSRTRGGNSDLENLAWACGGCNGRKFVSVQAVDPATGALAFLYNPRKEKWNDHFVWDESFTRMLGRTPTAVQLFRLWI